MGLRFFYINLIILSVTAWGGELATSPTEGLDPSRLEMVPAQDVCSSSKIYIRNTCLKFNKLRREQGLPALELSPKLCQAAIEYAREMVHTGQFSHQGTEGNVGQRLTNRGILWSHVGENIARGQTSINQVMWGWFNSPGHRANMLNPEYTQHGIGAYKTDSGEIYWVHIFMTER